jgi:hypothetical protein
MQAEAHERAEVVLRRQNENECWTVVEECLDEYKRHLRAAMIAVTAAEVVCDARAPGVRHERSMYRIYRAVLNGHVPARTFVQHLRTVLTAQFARSSR